MGSNDKTTEPLVSSGILGLDEILRGGFIDDCIYVISGAAGSGKTTLAMQFLLHGRDAGEPCLYITLSETKREIQKVANSHDWDLTGIEICEMVSSEANLSADSQLTVFNPSELELGETTQALMTEVKRVRPRRLVIDSLSELRLVAQNSLRYRRQVLALKQFLASCNCTVLLLDDSGSPGAEAQLESIAHGVITLEQLANQYGAERRRLRVVKLRGVQFRGGFHDFMIRRGGLEIFPRLVAAEHHEDFIEAELPSGNAALDELLGGGLPLGTSTLLVGPAGTGKSTIATSFAIAAAKRGIRSAVFIFDENIGTYRTRSRKLGLAIDPSRDKHLLTIQQIDPAELSPGEFCGVVRRAVEGRDENGHPARVVIIDSLNGYLNAMPEEKFLTAQMHELLAYLGQKGVVTLLTVTQSGMIGASAHSPVDTTYLADNVILFRYFESMSRVRRAISVVKKRSGRHETTIRELHVTETNGVQIGDPLEGFHGVLTGVPTYIGKPEQLVNRGADGK